MADKVEKRINEHSIVVDADGTLLMWVNGYLSGNQTLIREVKQWCKLGTSTPITEHGEPVECVWDDPDDPVGALAALMSARKGRTRILHAPQVVVNYLLEDDPNTLTIAPHDPTGGASGVEHPDTHGSSQIAANSRTTENGGF